MASAALIHRGERCTELRLPGGERLLIDYGAEPLSLLHYQPLCAGSGDAERPPPASEQNGWWHLADRARLTLPRLSASEASGVLAVLVSSGDEMLALPLLTERRAAPASWTRQLGASLCRTHVVGQPHM